MLAVEDIIDPAPAADLDRVDLIQVEMVGSLLDMAQRQGALIVLIGYQIFDRDLFKVHVGHESRIVLHSLFLLYSLCDRIDTGSQVAEIAH